MIDRFEVHAHTATGSNITLIDSINEPISLVKHAQEIGLKGICITDHECLSAHKKVNDYSLTIKDDFKVGLGNEIYLCPDRDSNQSYYHFILIAKNAIGHKALRVLSSRAWMNSYTDRGLERRVTTYEDLIEIVKKYPNSLIATTACLGGQLSTAVKKLILAEKNGNQNEIMYYHNEVAAFVMFCKKLFGEDFYIECAPGKSKDQVMVNRRLISVAAAFSIKMVLGSDAHFLKREDRYIHKAYLNSKDGEREVDTFYEYAYLQNEEDILENIEPSGLDYESLASNSMEIYDKIEMYNLSHSQTIPRVLVKSYPIQPGIDGYPVLKSMFESNNNSERYWVNECFKALKDKNLYNPVYIARLEEEATTKRIIGEKLNTCLFDYPITLQYYIDLIWDCGSIVGAGRGSSCSGLNHYLLGITQLDPIKYNLPWFRYLNEERVELPDIDIDISPAKKQLILQRISQERSKRFNADIDELSCKNLGCAMVATFGTEGSRSAILTACRGYKTEEYPNGIDVDIAKYLSSLVPSERGFDWTLSEVVYGNAEKDRQPVVPFINEINQYKGLLDIAFSIEGLVNKRSSHASGVIFFDEDPYEYCAFMRTPAGEIITQYDLHDAESMGLTKFDFLVTEVQDKIIEAIKLLQEDNEIEPELSLREVYNKYFHPDILPIEENDVWDVIQRAAVLDLFQLDSDIGRQGAKKIKPANIFELADTNGLIRLMPLEKGAETPMEKYIRFKNDISLWYKEMDNYRISKDEQKVLERYFLSSYGVPPSQEQLMWMLMDTDICGFSLKEANAARKIVGKKKMKEIPKLKKDIFDKCKNSRLAQYVWDCGIKPQLGYSFSLIHALAYSFIGYQTAYIATKWNPIYWNTACLLVNSASVEGDEDEDDNEEEKDKKEKSSDYAKIAKALGATIDSGTKISLIDINHSDFGFKPDAKNNRILFGLKGVNKINGEAVKQIIEHRPYRGLVDFCNKCNLNKTAVIQLIKGGAFDETDGFWAKKICPESPRKAIMMYYIYMVSETKEKLNLQNLNGLIEKDILPDSMKFHKLMFHLNKALTKKYKVGDSYLLTGNALNFYTQNFGTSKIVYNNGDTYIKCKDWDVLYDKEKDIFRKWISDNHDEALNRYNSIILKENWEKYATGTISAWEMESLCFYYHEHELANINAKMYGIVDYFNLSPQPVVDKTFKRNGRQIPLFKTYLIAGTVLSKNDKRSSISILTPSGVVNVKFTKEYYAMFNRQISEKNDEGKKVVVEKGWFSRGTLMLVNGFRRDDTFVAKTYAHTHSHQLYKITGIGENGELEIEFERKGGNNDE